MVTSFEHMDDEGHTWRIYQVMSGKQPTMQDLIEQIQRDFGGKDMSRFAIHDNHWKNHGPGLLAVRRISAG